MKAEYLNCNKEMKTDDLIVEVNGTQYIVFQDLLIETGCNSGEEQ